MIPYIGVKHINILAVVAWYREIPLTNKVCPLAVVITPSATNAIHWEVSAAEGAVK